MEWWGVFFPFDDSVRIRKKGILEWKIYNQGENTEH